MRKENVCVEVPVDLVVNEEKVVTFMCTPQYINELSLGYLYNRKLVNSIDEIYTLAACEDLRKVYVRTAHKLNEEQYSLGAVLSSACGSGSVFNEEILDEEVNRSNLTVTLEELRKLAKQMFSSATMYKETGGVHCAALAMPQEILALREDVGRHNAVDKITGKGLFLEVDFSQTIILTTGRISSDMMLKAVSIGVPIVCTRSIPSSLALELAEKLGVTLVGRIATKAPIVYTHESRIFHLADSEIS